MQIVKSNILAFADSTKLTKLGRKGEELLFWHIRKSSPSCWDRRGLWHIERLEHSIWSLGAPWSYGWCSGVWSLQRPQGVCRVWPSLQASYLVCVRPLFSYLCPALFTLMLTLSCLTRLVWRWSCCFHGILEHLLCCVWSRAYTWTGQQVELLSKMGNGSPCRFCFFMKHSI